MIECPVGRFDQSTPKAASCESLAQEDEPQVRESYVSAGPVMVPLWKLLQPSRELSVDPLCVAQRRGLLEQPVDLAPHVFRVIARAPETSQGVRHVIPNLHLNSRLRLNAR